MTLQLNFEKTKLKKLVTLIEWLKDTGMITSFKIEQSENEEELTDEELAELMKRIENYEQNPESGIPLEEAKKRLTAKYDL